LLKEPKLNIGRGGGVDTGPSKPFFGVAREIIQCQAAPISAVAMATAATYVEPR